MPLTLAGAGALIVYAGGSFPVGALADRFGHQRVLVGGYVLGALVTLGILCAFAFSLNGIPYWALLFAGAGIVIAIQDALESTVTAELIPTRVRGTAFGVLGTVKGVPFADTRPLSARFSNRARTGRSLPPGVSPRWAMIGTTPRVCSRVT